MFIDYHTLAGFLSLVVLEIVLGIDNLVLIALVIAHLPVTQRNKARILGLVLALFMRVALLFGTAFIMSLDKPWIHFMDMNLSTKDLVMIGGGLFLLYHVTVGIHNEVASEKNIHYKDPGGGFIATTCRIIMMDIVFSLDSIITAVGITNNIYTIIAAMTIAMIVMLISSGWIANFILTNPTIKMLALSFVMMVGVFLIAQGFGIHLPKGYIYFSMGFSLAVESLNIFVRKKNAKK